MSSMLKTILYTLVIGAVAVSLLGLSVVLTGSLGEWPLNIDLSLLTVASTVLCLLPWRVSWKQKGRRVLPVLATVWTLTSACLVLAAIWGYVTSDWALAFSAPIIAVVASWLTLLRNVTWGKKHRVLIPGMVLVLYNVVAGGGILIERTHGWTANDSFMGVNLAEITLKNYGSLALKGSPTTKRVYIPFVLYYVHTAYPVHVFTQDFFWGNASVVDDRVLENWNRLRFNKNLQYPVTPESFLALSYRVIFVEEVRWYRGTADTSSASKPEAFKGSSWSAIALPGPGEWSIETRGCEINRSKEKEEIAFPVVTIRLEDKSLTRVKGCFGFMWQDFSIMSPV
jgi:hypothetical protein